MTNSRPHVKASKLNDQIAINSKIFMNLDIEKFATLVW